MYDSACVKQTTCIKYAKYINKISLNTQIEQSPTQVKRTKMMTKIGLITQAGQAKYTSKSSMEKLSSIQQNIQIEWTDN